MLDALLDAGADIDAEGAIIAGGTPLTDATAFGQWKAAHRLVERGAHTTLFDEAALGLHERFEQRFASGPMCPPEEVSDGLWAACHGGRQQCAQYLLDRGAEINWLPGWEPLTPLDAAQRSQADHLVAWLRSHGAHSASELTG